MTTLLNLKETKINDAKFLISAKNIFEALTKYDDKGDYDNWLNSVTSNPYHSNDFYNFDGVTFLSTSYSKELAVVANTVSTEQVLRDIVEIEDTDIIQYIIDSIEMKRDITHTRLKNALISINAEFLDYETLVNFIERLLNRIIKGQETESKVRLVREVRKGLEEYENTINNDHNKMKLLRVSNHVYSKHVTFLANYNAGIITTNTKLKKENDALTEEINELRSRDNSTGVDLSKMTRTELKELCIANPEFYELVNSYAKVSLDNTLKIKFKGFEDSYNSYITSINEITDQAEEEIMYIILERIGISTVSGVPTFECIYNNGRHMECLNALLNYLEEVQYEE